MKAILAAMLAVVPLAASASASDNAADAAYNGGWALGSNGGTGFGAWSGFDYSYPPSMSMATNANVDIKTSGRAWGLNGSNDTFAYAGGEMERTITGSMSVGETFSIDVDNGVQTPVPGSFSDGGFGIGLKDVSGTERLGLFAYSNVPNFYYLADASGNVQTIGTITTGFNYSVTVTGANSYSAMLTPIGGGTSTFNGTLKAGGAINSVRLWEYNLVSGASGENDTYFNNMTVVPEPVSVVALAAGLLAVVRRRRSIS